MLLRSSVGSMDFSCQEVMLLLQAQEVTLLLVRDEME